MVEAVASRLFDHCILKDPGLKLAIKKKILIFSDLISRTAYFSYHLLFPIFLGSSPA